MVRDALDILNPRSRFTATATYYKEMPESADIGGISFPYEDVDPASHDFRRLFGNFQSFVAGEIAIRTNARLPFKANQRVVLPSGEMYIISGVQTDRSRAPKQAMRFAGVPVGVEYVLRMVNVPNPWGIA